VAPLPLTRTHGIGDHGVMIIGVAGRNGAGKGELVKFLEARSFTALSLSDAIRQELADRGLSETRERMIEVGQEMRRRSGPGALAQSLVKHLQLDRNYAIDSIRHPVEVEILRHCGQDFHLVWIDAKLETRFERMRARGRGGDPTSVAELEALEARERGSDDPNAQQLDAVQAEASFTLANDGTLEAFQSQIEAWVRQNLAFSRPDWDVYFMDIARTVASRSNCVKRKVAAVVTRDKRIISTGYNGTPRGTTNCNEGGCPRCNDLAAGGTRLDECLCSHAEENAITQSAYHGVSLKGGTVYTTFSPCLQCTKMIINAGLAEVVFQSEYPLGQVSLDLLAEAGVKIRQIAAG
jgi:dCMP deaminase